MISDDKVREYGHAFFMNLGLILRFFHAVVAGDVTQLGRFKLRGIDAQFSAALELYKLIIEQDGEIPEDALSWAVHKLMVTLYRPDGLGSRAVDCPSDQMLFIWALLEQDRYRIALHLNSLMAALKYGFRCIAIHDARVQSLGQDDSGSFAFYDDLEVKECGGDFGDHDHDEDDNEETIPLPAVSEAEIFPSPKISRTTILDRLRAMKSRGAYLDTCDETKG